MMNNPILVYTQNKHEHMSVKSATLSDPVFKGQYVSLQQETLRPNTVGMDFTDAYRAAADAVAEAMEAIPGVKKEWKDDLKKQMEEIYIAIFAYTFNDLVVGTISDENNNWEAAKDDIMNRESVNQFLATPGVYASGMDQTLHDFAKTMFNRHRVNIKKRLGKNKNRWAIPETGFRGLPGTKKYIKYFIDRKQQLDKKIAKIYFPVEDLLHAYIIYREILWPNRPESTEQAEEWGEDASSLDPYFGMKHFFNDNLLNAFNEDGNFFDGDPNEYGWWAKSNYLQKKAERREEEFEERDKKGPEQKLVEDSIEEFEKALASTEDIMDEVMMAALSNIVAFTDDGYVKDPTVINIIEGVKMACEEIVKQNTAIAGHIALELVFTTVMGKLDKMQDDRIEVSKNAVAINNAAVIFIKKIEGKLSELSKALNGDFDIIDIEGSNLNRGVALERIASVVERLGDRHNWSFTEGESWHDALTGVFRENSNIRLFFSEFRHQTHLAIGSGLYSQNAFKPEVIVGRYIELAEQYFPSFSMENLSFDFFSKLRETSQYLSAKDIDTMTKKAQTVQDYWESVADPEAMVYWKQLRLLRTSKVEDDLDEYAKIEQSQTFSLARLGDVDSFEEQDAMDGNMLITKSAAAVRLEFMEKQIKEDREALKQELFNILNTQIKDKDALEWGFENFENDINEALDALEDIRSFNQDKDSPKNDILLSYLIESKNTDIAPALKDILKAKLVGGLEMYKGYVNSITNLRSKDAFDLATQLTRLQFIPPHMISNMTPADQRVARDIQKGLRKDLKTRFGQAQQSLTQKDVQDLIEDKESEMDDQDSDGEEDGKQVVDEEDEKKEQRQPMQIDAKLPSTPFQDKTKEEDSESDDDQI